MSLDRYADMKRDIFRALNNLYTRAIEEWDINPLDIPELVLINEILPIYFDYSISNPTLQMLRDGIALYHLDTEFDYLQDVL